MTERLSSGSARLDLILGGGLLGQATHLIIGLPGSGKTILAQQYLFRNATPERPGIYFSTVSETLEKMLRFGQTLTFFDRDALGHRVFFEDLGEPLHNGGLAGVLDHLTRQLQERRPGMVAIDSFKALRAYASSDEMFRRFLHGLAERSSALAMTSLWVGEYTSGTLEEIPEAAVADSILCLSLAETPREHRVLHVLKTRGTGFLPGGHSYTLNEDGVEASPRLTTLELPGPYPLEQAPTASGVPGLDEMMGGFASGAATLLVGPAGIGKTVAGLHFLLEGTHRGEPGVLAGLEENPTQLERLAQSLGLTLDVPGLSILYRSPTNLDIDRWAWALLDAVEATGARRVLIDTVDELVGGAADESSFHLFAYALIQRLSRAGVSMVLTQEAPDLFGATSLTHSGLAHHVDNVVMMKYVNREGLWTRALTILKSRGRSHSSAEAQFRIIDRGMVVVPGGD